jgi:ABC-type transport system involved in cytochrome c biogenesis permease subunit
MLYAFFLFWPANVIPIWLLIILLQLFIPFNMLVRSACIGLKHFKIHAISGLIIFLAVCISLLGFTTKDYQDSNFMPYALLFLLCSLFDSTSHALKESVVRS